MFKKNTQLQSIDRNFSNTCFQTGMAKITFWGNTITIVVESSSERYPEASLVFLNILPKCSLLNIFNFGIKAGSLSC